MFPNDNPNKSRLISNALYAVLIAASFFFIVKGISEIRTFANIGKAPSQNLITVSGEGDAYSVPDIAQMTYDISEEAKTVAAAQESVTKRSNDILAYLKTVGVEEKDIKTVNYNIYPNYDYTNCYSSGCASQRIFRGYTVTNSVQIKVRDIANAGNILSELGVRKVSNLSSLYFTVDNDDAVRELARKNAIEDAKRKAEVLARDLGVKIVRIVSFSENGGGYPIYYAKDAVMNQAYGLGGGMAPTAPELSPGENKITSNVSITYEIR